MPTAAKFPELVSILVGVPKMLQTAFES